MKHDLNGVAYEIANSFVSGSAVALHKPLRPAKRTYSFTAIYLGIVDLNQNCPGARFGLTTAKQTDTLPEFA